MLFVSALPGAGAFVTRCSGTNRKGEITDALPEMKRGCSADLWIFNQSLGKLLLLLCHGVHGTHSRNSTLCAGEVILQEAALSEAGQPLPLQLPILDHIRKINRIFTLHFVQLFF